MTIRSDYGAYLTLAMQLLAVTALAYVLTLGIKDCVRHCKVDQKVTAMGRIKP